MYESDGYVIIRQGQLEKKITEYTIQLIAVKDCLAVVIGEKYMYNRELNYHRKVTARLNP